MNKLRLQGTLACKKCAQVFDKENVRRLLKFKMLFPMGKRRVALALSCHVSRTFSFLNDLKNIFGK